MFLPDVQKAAQGCAPKDTLPSVAVGLLGLLAAETSLILTSANASENLARLDRSAFEKNAIEEVFR